MKASLEFLKALDAAVEQDDGVRLVFGQHDGRYHLERKHRFTDSTSVHYGRFQWQSEASFASLAEVGERYGIVHGIVQGERDDV